MTLPLSASFRLGLEAEVLSQPPTWKGWVGRGGGAVGAGDRGR